MKFNIKMQDGGVYNYEHTFHLDPKDFLDCNDERELKDRLWEIYGNQKFESLPDELYLDNTYGNEIYGQIEEFIKEWKNEKV